MSGDPRGAAWGSIVGLLSAGVTACVFAVALLVALLLEFIATGHICEIVGESAVTIGGRICGATSLLAFVVGFVVAVLHDAWTGRGEHEPGRGEEPVQAWRRE